MAGSRRGALTLSASCAAVPGCTFAFLLRVQRRSLAGLEVVFVLGGMVVKMTPWDVFGLGMKMARHNLSMEPGDHLKFNGNRAIFFPRLQL